MNNNALEKVFGYFASFFSGMPATVSLIADASVTGYATRTKTENHIVISTTHPAFVEGLTATERAYVQYGVLTHETLHLMLSDFDAIVTETQRAEKDARSKGAKNPAMYSRIMHDIINIVEDTRIENAAYFLFGGKALRALNHCIKHFWETSPEIDKDILPESAEEMALTQVLNALIQVGDRGSVKGKFLTATAKDAFRKVLPLFNKGVMAQTCGECAKICRDIYDVLLPLIDAADQAPQLMRSYKDSGSGAGQPMPTSGEESPIQKRRKALAKEMEDEAENEASKDESKPSSTESADSDDHASASDASSDENSDETNEQGSGSDGDSEQASDSSDETADSTESTEPGDGHESSDADGKNTSDTGSSDTDHSDAADNSDTETDDDIDEDPDQLKDDIKEFAQEVKDKEKEIKEQEAADAAKAEAQKKDVSERAQAHSAYGKISISNQLVTYARYNKDAYENVVSDNASQITALTAALNRVFKGDTGGKSFHSSGTRINVKRASSPVLRPTIMQKRINPKDLKDMAIFLLVDNSGSMWGTKEAVARSASICLCECFEKLMIPFAACGFTVDDCDCRGTRRHYYYKTWRSPAAQKYALSKIRALEGNDDARAINAATDSLGKVSAKHKLLFVLSDGQPTEATQEETKQAVEDARRKGITVVSCAIGLPQSEYPVYARMYGKDYVMVYDLNDVFTKTGDMIKNAIKSW